MEKQFNTTIISYFKLITPHTHMQLHLPALNRSINSNRMSVDRTEALEVMQRPLHFALLFGLFSPFSEGPWPIN
jgi:hypothetical protein